MLDMEEDISSQTRKHWFNSTAKEGSLLLQIVNLPSVLYPQVLVKSLCLFKSFNNSFFENFILAYLTGISVTDRVKEMFSCKLDRNFREPDRG